MYPGRSLCTHCTQLGGDLREVRTLPDGLGLELCGNPPAIVLVQGSNQVTVERTRVRAVIAAMGDVVADLTGLLAVSGRHHA